MRWLFCLIFVSGSLSLVASDLPASTLCSAKDHPQKRACDCLNEGTPPAGLRALRIDCTFRDFTADDIQSQNLPLYTEQLDISWNYLDNVPQFSSDTLKRLSAAHNNVTTIWEKNFDNLPNLKELDLSWNAIQLISINAFAGLVALTDLNLSHNNLKKINLNVFGPLISIQTLKLSWNRNLNNSEGIADQDIFALYGLSTKLRNLHLENCNLNAIDLRQGMALEEVNLRKNKFEKVPPMGTAVKHLDVSENPLVTLQPIEFLPSLSSLETLLLEDMPKLKVVDESSLVGLDRLKTLSLQNSRALGDFHQYAFGVNSTNVTSLEILNLRGTSITTFNSSMLPIFQKLKEFNLNGVPLTCNCELAWMKELQMETDGRCFRPTRLRGMLLSAVRESEFSCDRWPRWVYGLLILGLIVLCSTGIWLIVTGLRPYTRDVRKRGNRIGANSPYARVTIEPSRLDNNYY